MKYLVLVVSFLSLNVLAAPAVSYSCVGKNKVSDFSEGIAFQLVFSDHAPDEGYTYQAIEVTSEAGFERDEKLVLLLNGPADKQCEKTEEGFVVFNLGEKFEMLPSKDGDLQDYNVNFQGECGDSIKFNVKAHCVFN